MRIYTEIVYTWDENKGELVQESSKSYDYEGPIISCHWYHSHGGGTLNQLKDKAQETVAGGADAAGGVVTGVLTAAEKEVKRLAENAAAAWGIMQDAGQSVWDSGADAIAEIWSDTGMADMAATWTDKAEMETSWMNDEGWDKFKWDWDSEWQSKWMQGLDRRRFDANFGWKELKEYQSNLYSDFDTFTQNAADAAQATADSIAAALAEATQAATEGINAGNEGVSEVGEVVSDGGSIVTGGMDDAVTVVEEVASDTGDALGVNESVSTVVDTGQTMGETVVEVATDVGGAVSEGVENVTQNTEGILEDNNQPLAQLESDINTGVKNTVEQTQTFIDQNTDTVVDAGHTINSNIKDVNTFVGNVQAAVNDATSIINQGFDATINPNNPNALFVNPKNWWDNNWSGYRKMEKRFNEQVAGGIGDVMTGINDDWETIAGGLLDEAFDTWGLLGASLSQQLMMRNEKTKADLRGDPFGNTGKSRRLINEKKTFQSQAPSLINNRV